VRTRIDEDGWRANDAVRAFVREGDAYHFWLAGRTDTFTARVDGPDIEIFPERSSGQRRLAHVLGLNP
jgi:hypothetical protein